MEPFVVPAAVRGGKQPQVIINHHGLLPRIVIDLKTRLC